VPISSPIYRRALEIFKANLEDLKQTCQSHHIPLILSPQVSNVRDEPPFVSKYRQGLSRASKEQFIALFDKGRTNWERGNIDSALVDFLAAESLDSTRADAHYWVARSLDSLGRKQDAKREYITARDFDELRFRASSDFNEAIKDAAADTNVFFAPLEEMMSKQSPDGIIGNNLILEHLHPRLKGSFIMAKEYARIMRDHGLLATPQEWAHCDTIADATLWNDRPTTTLDLLAAEIRIHRLTSDWPFKRPTPVKDSLLLAGPLGTIVNSLVDAQTTWERAHVAAAEYYTRSGDLAAAAKEYRVLIDQLHYNNSAYLELGQIYTTQKNYEMATDVLTRSLDVEPSYEAYEMLGTIQLAESHPDRAIPLFEKSFSFNSSPDQHTTAGFLLALAKAKVGRIDEAKSLLQEMLSLNPTLNNARSLLNSLNSLHRK